MDDDEQAAQNAPELQAAEAGPNMKNTGRDEWMNEVIPFPTKSDALLATFALSKDADPFVVDEFLSLINNPSFNPAECTLHSVADIHSYTSNYKRMIRNNFFGNSPSTTVPAFVWEEVIVRIGGQWVAYAYQILDDAAQEAPTCDGDTFQLLRDGHQSLFDLRCASLVHRSWTRPAQRQLGRVLVLHDADELTLTPAIQSSLYGNWTQVLALDGSPSRPSTPDGWGMATTFVTDTLLPNQSRLKTFIARFPYLSMIYLGSSIANHPMMLLNMIKPPISLEALTIISVGRAINDTTTDIVTHVRHWPGLKSLNLVGFALDLDNPSPIKQLSASLSTSQISSLSICGGNFNLHSHALIHGISWARNPLIGDPELFLATEVLVRRISTGITGHFPNMEVAQDEETIDFDELAHETCLSWLPSVKNLHLRNVYESEAQQIFDIATSLRHLSWSGLSFVPPIALPASLRGLRLFVAHARDEVWHTLDRQLLAFLQHRRNPDLQCVTIPVRLHGRPQSSYPEREEDFPYIYFPRSMNLCKTLGISFSVEL